MKKKLELFWIFFKLGLFTFGGGYAMIPQIKEIITEKKKWMSEDEMLEMIAIAEATPGPIAINMATYIGYKQGKVLGSIMATLGVILPSLIIIFIISLFFDKFLELTYVQYAFVGIKCGVAFLISKAAINLIIKMEKNWFNILMVIIVFCLMIVLELLSVSFSSIFIILIGALLGLIVFSTLIKEREETKE